MEQQSLAIEIASRESNVLQHTHQFLLKKIIGGDDITLNNLRASHIESNNTDSIIGTMSDCRRPDRPAACNCNGTKN